MNRGVVITLLAAIALGVYSQRLASPLPTPAAPPPAAQPAPSKSQPIGPSTLPMVRVLVGGADRSAIKLRIDGPYLVRAVGDWRVLAQGPKLEACEVTATAEGVRVGTQDFAAPRLSIQVVRDGALWIDRVRYHGAVNLVAHGEHVRSVNVVDLEDYIASVVQSEMPADFPAEARRAQAIAARTYALFQVKATDPNSDSDLGDTARSQVYRGMQYIDAKDRNLAVETPHSRHIVEDTRGMVLAYQGKLFCTYYSAVCGGRTMSGAAVFEHAAPPLVSVPCEYCANAPNYHWTLALDRAACEERLAKYLHAQGVALGDLKTIQVHDPGGGLAATVQVTGSAGKYEFSEHQLHLQVLDRDALLSDRFTLRTTADQWIIEGHGWGHGVGLCQWGSRGQALAGRTCLDILQYYYPGSELITVR